MTLRLLFILFVSFFSFGYSDFDNISEVTCASSIMTVEAVNVAEKTTIFLNNRTAWTCKYKDLFEGPYGWRLGDRVHIVYVYSDGYYLQNASCQGCVPVKIQNADSRDLEVNTIKEIIKNNKKSTNTIVLSDSSRWFIGSWSSNWMKDWQIGDRIIVTEQEFVLGNADHLLLNLDQKETSLPENVRAQFLYSPETIKFEDLNKRKTRDWKISIAKIWKESDTFILEFNNKTLWKCTPPKLNWQIGDNLEFDFDDEKFELINLRNAEKIHANILNSQIEEAELPTIQKISKNGKEILLSDKSVWFSRNNEFKKWQQGNRIVVSSLSKVEIDTSTHILINIDTSTQGIPNCSSATLVK